MIISSSMAAQKKKNISVLGLGKLGACYAAFYASKGHTVLGYDINKDTIRTVNAGQAPVDEPNLGAYIKKSRGRFSATDDISRIINETDITCLIVPTPSRKDGLFSLAAILKAAAAVGPFLKKKKGYHTFVVVSTVLPGDSRNRIIAAFERASGKKCGRDFGYVYSPSLIALGTVLRNLENPDVLLLGAFDKRSYRAVETMYKNIYPRHEIEPLTLEEAELAKISINSFITMRLSFANTLGLLCEAIPHANVDAVTRVVGKDSRIGKKYFSAGLGFGGPCFPRDNKAFSVMASQFGVPALQARATDTVNAEVLRRTILFVNKKAAGVSRPAIGFAGASYKHGTANTEESHALAVAQAISHKHKTLIYEPRGTSEVKRSLGNTVTYVPSLQDLVKKSNIIFLSNPDPLFASLPKLIKNEEKIIIDPWGMFRDARFGPKVDYCAPGRMGTS